MLGFCSEIKKTLFFYYDFPLLVCLAIDKAAMKEQKSNLISGQIAGKAPLRVTSVVCMLAAWFLITVSSSMCMAAEPPDEKQLYDIDIPSLNAAEALNRFAEQTDAIMLFPYDLAKARQANAVVGRYTLLDALALLLKDSGLSSGLSDKRVLKISLEEVVERNNEERIMATAKVPFRKKVAAFLASIFIATAVGAQEASDNAVDREELIIEEVMVTAQKREQNMQDVGIAVSSFSNADMHELGMLRPEDLAGQTPGLDVKNALGALNPVFTLRGIGLNDYNSNNNPSVGIYIDEVYMINGGFSAFQMFDLERVEVLKGPQGTLYGRNTTGGAINFITAKPTEEFEAYVDIEYGRWNTITTEGAVSGSLGPNLNGRLAFATNHSDGYYKNNGTTVTGGLIGPFASVLDGLGATLGQPPAATVLPPNPVIPPDDDFFAQETYSARGTLVWTPSDVVDVTASFHFSKDDSDMLPRSMDFGAVDLNGFSPADDDPFTVDDNLAGGTDGKVDIDGYGGSLKINWDLGLATMTSITGYETIDRFMPFNDSSPWRMVDQIFADDMTEVTQEIRFSSNSDGSLFWVVGAYYGYEKIDSRKDIDGQDFIARTKVATEFQQKGDTYAAFVHTEWAFTDNLTLTTGLRYSYDDKSYSGGSFIPDPPFGPFGVDLANPIFGPIPLFDSNSFNEDDVSGKVAVDWAATDDLLVYVSWNKGYKSGGYDGSTITDPASFTPFLGETLYAWEVGIKSTWLDGRLQWNFAAFTYDYKDMQAEAQREVFPGIFESIRANVGEAEITGLDTDIWWKPVQGLDIKLGLALLDTKITSWNVDGLDSSDPEIVADAQADVAAHVGNRIPDSPEVTFNGLVRYETPVSDTLIGAVMVNFNWTDLVYKNIDNDEYLTQEAYWLVNARISVASVDNNWEAALYAKNIFDVIYFRERFDNFGPNWIYETPGPPLSYGVNVTFRWN